MHNKSVNPAFHSHTKSPYSFTHFASYYTQYWPRRAHTNPDSISKIARIVLTNARSYYRVLALPQLTFSWRRCPLLAKPPAKLILDNRSIRTPLSNAQSAFLLFYTNSRYCITQSRYPLIHEP